VATATADAADLEHMRAALALARRGLGRVWPNPAVGCVLVRDGGIVGRGWTQPGGRPHAEAEALRRAGARARGATAYVTLEPCAHAGRGPACAPALARAGVARAVIATTDSDPRTRGHGLTELRAAHMDFRLGLCESEARGLTRGFFSRLKTGRPVVTLKVASSLDGRISAGPGDGRWITGAAARARGHLLRASHDAILVGSGTVIADDPDLTCRLPGMADRSPVRVVFDGRLRTPPSSRLAATARGVPTWVVTVPDADAARRARLEAAGVDVLEAEAGPTGSPGAGAALALLAARGITRVLVEGGGALAASLLAAGVVDRLVWFRAPIVIGAEGVAAAAKLVVIGGGSAAAAGPHAPDGISNSSRFWRLDIVPVGDDVMETYKPVSTSE
jgi:diaminohydroxyphosphoribosylaminopyrimidine deaminase/5-amino-6-(5-phosphoribosylamino)uracil reductase